MKKDEKEAKALFRYGLISEFLHGGLARGHQSDRMKELSERSYRISWQAEPVQVSESSLCRWLSQYRQHGFSGLISADRCDKNISKAIDKVLSDRIIAIKKSDPDMSIPLLISSLEDSKESPKGKLKHSTVHRLLQRHGLSGRPGRDRGHKPQRLPFKYIFPMDMWVGDVMHSRRPVQGRKVYLIAWMDNATRAIMHAEYKFSENALSILSTFYQALQVRGICKRVYVDHGSGYVDSRFVRTCAHLGIHLMYAPVRDGAAKGCIERFFSHLRASFERYLKPVDLENLESLNSLLWRWIHSTYHQRPHSGLDGQFPWQRFMELLPRIQHRRIDNDFDFMALLQTRESRTVRRDGTVSLHGHGLEIPPTATRKQVELRFMEEDLPSGVHVWEDDKCLGMAIPVNLKTNTRRRRWHPQSKQRDSRLSVIDPLTRARNTWKDNMEGEKS
ncbi:MAG: transposase [Deltaproteobacteria bacterium]|nr:transposase [Deltaproteobacteria bacterium]